MYSLTTLDPVNDPVQIKKWLGNEAWPLMLGLVWSPSMKVAMKWSDSCQFWVKVQSQCNLRKRSVQVDRKPKKEVVVLSTNLKVNLLYSQIACKAFSHTYRAHFSCFSWSKSCWCCCSCDFAHRLQSFASNWHFLFVVVVVALFLTHEQLVRMAGKIWWTFGEMVFRRWFSCCCRLLITRRD